MCVGSQEALDGFVSLDLKNCLVRDDSFLSAERGRNLLPEIRQK